MVRILRLTRTRGDLQMFFWFLQFQLVEAQGARRILTHSKHENSTKPCILLFSWGQRAFVWLEKRLDFWSRDCRLLNKRLKEKASSAVATEEFVASINMFYHSFFRPQSQFFSIRRITMGFLVATVLPSFFFSLGARSMECMSPANCWRPAIHRKRSGRGEKAGGEKAPGLAGRWSYQRDDHNGCTG